MIDTHAHLYLEHFEKDITEVIARARDAGVRQVYLPNVDISTIQAMKDLVSIDPAFFYPLMGLHPCSVKEHWRTQLSTIEKELQVGNYVGVGEIGIDLYWDSTFEKEQEKAYRIQIEWAADLEIPFVVHSRNSLDRTIRIAEEMQDGRLKGIFHCFNGSPEQAKRIIDIGLFMGIGGVVTYKNSGLDQVVEKISLDHFVLETDSPYLSPVPFRGKRNEPAFLKNIVEKMALIKGLDTKYVIQKTTENALQLFGKAKAEYHI
ncbi:MAG TPA: TatD family hydrolase [Saprospiraceae bacterium]|nr:TatD family hydrolase [Saprospiraceae bacterium]